MSRFARLHLRSAGSLVVGLALALAAVGGGVARTDYGGTAAASGEPWGSGFTAALAIDADTMTGWAFTPDSAGAWWQETWSSPVCISAVSMGARQLGGSGGAVSSDGNPATTLQLSDTSTYAVAALAVGATTSVDLGGSYLVTSLRLTFDANAPDGGNPGWSDVTVTTGTCGVSLSFPGECGSKGC